MAYSDIEQKVLRQFQIIDDSGKPTRVTLLKKAAGGKSMGAGPLLDTEAVGALLKADTSPDKKWLPWIFFQAAGGERGKEASLRAIEQIKRRFIEERVNGFQHPQSKVVYKPVSRGEAEKRWESTRPKFGDVIEIADQDSVEKLGTFGFSRHWPGQDRIYEKVVTAIKGYLALYKRLLKMNEELRREGQPELPSEPNQITSIDQMTQTARKVERYFASKAAREDIRIAGDAPIYDDDYITALVPLTYAAAVKYGWDEWAWANRTKFDEILSSDSSFHDAWKNGTSGGKVYVYLTFKVPVPSWIARSQGGFVRRELTNLALQLTAGQPMPSNMDAISVFDEENQQTKTIGEVKQAILAEPEREPDAQDEEIPIKRGPNVYKTKDEAEQVVWHLNKALEAIKRWLPSFDAEKIKSDVMKL